MKLATFIAPDLTPLIGVALDEGGSIGALQRGVELLEGSTSPFFLDMLTYLRAGPEARYKAHMVRDYLSRQRPAGTVFPTEQVRFLSPVPVPESIRDCMAFEDHIINATRVVGFGRLAKLDETIERRLGRKASLAYWVNREWYRRPAYYKGNRFSVTGHDWPVEMPHYARKFDYELEWGIFIGKEGRDIPVNDARDYIAGYAIFNDFSARDVQLKEMRSRLGPAKGKDFDTGNAIGPWLVTPEELPDPYALDMRAYVNGEEWSRGSTKDMHWTFEQIIAYISLSETLYPGEFIGSGTCSGPMGRGCGLELGREIKVGDLVELEVEGLGLLRNRVVKGAGAEAYAARAQRAV